MPKQQRWFWLAALAAAWLFDFLFWKKPAGVSFFIWTTVLVGAGYLLAWREGKRPSWLSIVLTVLILGFAAVIAWREEPMTRAVSVMLTLGGMILLAATFQNGYWPWYRLRDYFVEFFKVIGIGFAGAVMLNSREKTPPPLESPVKKPFWKKLMPVLRGVLIALPIVAVLGVLLSSADPVFGDWLKRVFNLEKLPEYLFRLFYILIIGTFLVGVYFKALYPSEEAQKPKPNEPWFKPFLGWVESGIILGAVNLLFIAFVIIQVRYLFGGAANISETGYTFSEYARRGFGELVSVAVLSLMIYLSLSTVAKRETKVSRTGFTVMAVLLMILVLVILASSLQRLMLYESAYGFSQLRTYTHIFIYWLAALILVAIILELARRRGNFALALLVCIVGFGASLVLVNVDGFIAKSNVSRAVEGEELDVQYLNSLTSDAVPALITMYQDSSLPKEVKDKLGAALACREKVTIDPAEDPWQGYQFGQAQAYSLLHENSNLWKQYKPYRMNSDWMIQVNGEEISCVVYGMLD